MRGSFITAVMAFTFVLTGLVGLAYEAGAFADEQASCVGLASTTSTTGGGVEGEGKGISVLAEGASSSCEDERPEPPNKKIEVPE